jgi:hypothetical protein
MEEVVMQTHITIIGALYIALGGLGVLAAIVVFISIAGGGLLSGDAQALAITSGVGAVIALIILLISAPGVIGGIGLLKGKSWSRILVIILACLNLLNIPFGTALGIYSLWALTRPEAQRILSS